MSRNEAKRRFSLRITSDDEWRGMPKRLAEVIDETRRLTSRIEAVMAGASRLVEIVHTLRQVVCVKGLVKERS